MRNLTEIAVGVFTLLFCALGFWGTASTRVSAFASDPLGPIAFPNAVLTLLAVLGVIQIWRGLYRVKEKEYWPAEPAMKKTICFFLLFFLYVVMVIYFGRLYVYLHLPGLPQGTAFVLSSVIYLTAALLLSGRRNVLEIALVATMIPTSIVAVFLYFFQLAMP